MKTLSNNRIIPVRFESDTLSTIAGLFFLASISENSSGLTIYSLSNGKVLDMNEVGPEILYSRINAFRGENDAKEYLASERLSNVTRIVS